jgi:hypothetical protein
VCGRRGQLPAGAAGYAGAVKRGYLATLRSLPGLYVRHATLRLAAARGALWFFAFCAVWAGVAVALSRPPYSYSAGRIGLYALAGLSGIVAARVAGSWADRVGARPVILIGLVPAGSAAAVLGFALECRRDAGRPRAATPGCSPPMSRTRAPSWPSIQQPQPASTARAYMLVYFVGGSLGTAFGAAAVEWFGWSTTAAITAAAIGLAAATTVRPGRFER